MPIMQTVNTRYVVASQEPTAQNNYTWYRKYNDGWVEQGGRTANFPNTGFMTGTTEPVVFPITMADILYTALCSLCCEDNQISGFNNRYLCVASKATTGFDFTEWNNNQSSSTTTYGTWEVYGMAA